MLRIRQYNGINLCRKQQYYRNINYKNCKFIMNKYTYTVLKIQ